MFSLKLNKRKLSESVRLCEDLTQVLTLLMPCFKNVSNAKPWHRNEFHYQDSKKKKKKGEIAVYSNTYQLAEILPTVF